MLRVRAFWLNIFATILIVTYVATVFMAIDGTNGLLTICLLIAAIANIDQFKRLKIGAGGITAEARELLEKTEDRLDEIRELAKLTAQTSLSLVIRAGRMGPYEEVDKEQVKEKVLKHLLELEVPESEFAEILTDWYRFTNFDYVYLITNRSQIPKGLDQDATRAWKQLRSYELDSPPSPEQLTEFMTANGLMTEERQEMINAYRHYLAHHQHKDPQKWRAWQAVER